MFKYSAVAAAGLLIAGAALAGCAHKDTVVGTWTGTLTTARGVVQSTWQFNPDGTSKYTMQVTSGPQASLQVTSTGTYTVSDTTLTNTMTSMSEGSRTRTFTNGRAEAFQYTLSGDTLTLTEPAMPSPQVLTRQAQ